MLLNFLSTFLLQVHIARLEISPLIEEKLFFKVSIDNVNHFQNILLEYESPSNLDKLIINLNYFDLDELIGLCDKLIITNLVFEGDFSKLSIELLDQLLKIKTNGIVFKLECTVADDITHFNNYFLQNDLIIGVFYFNRQQNNSNNNKIFEVSKNSSDNSVQIQNMVINFEFQLEAHTKNVVYNKCLFLDLDGFYESKFKKIKIDINHFDFLNPPINFIWNAKKDNCDICSDCEFRRMCPDNRLPIISDTKKWYFQTECSYNPYIGKWDHEDGYCNLSECEVVTNEDDFTINETKIAHINQLLWGE